MVIAFLPIAIFGMKYLYTGHEDEKGWLNAPLTGEGALSDFQKSYLTAHGFYTRAVIYFAIWLVLMVGALYPVLGHAARELFGS